MHVLEKRTIIAPKHIVKLKNSHERIKKIERELNLKPSRLEDFSVSRHYTKRIAHDAFCGRTPFRHRKEKDYPASKVFYDDELRQRVFEIYKDDFDAYGYGTDF